MIYDTHCHLNDEKFSDDLVNILDNAYNNNVKMINVIGYDKSSSLLAIDICKKYNDYKGIKLYPVVGLHPENILDENKVIACENKNLDWLINLLETENILAIGEIGLDLYWDKSYTDIQIEYFKTQVELAIKYNKPIVVHSREATQMTFDLLKEYSGKVKGIIHCYSGSKEIANEYFKMGYMIGVGGTLTFKNSKLPEVIKDLDIHNIVVETDAPYLAPSPYRGMRNEPAYTAQVVKKISEIKNISIDELEEILLSNSKEILNL